LAPTNRDLTIYELVIKGMWALYFHHQMTCEFPPHNAKEFFGIVLNVKPSLSSSANLSKKSKKLNRKKGNKNSGGEGTVSSNKKFSHISMLDENQRITLETLFLQNNHSVSDLTRIIDNFFPSCGISKEYIQTTMRKFKNGLKSLKSSNTVHPFFGVKIEDAQKFDIALAFGSVHAFKQCLDKARYYQTQNNIPEEIKWYEKAAETGFSFPMYKLGLLKYDC